MNLRLRPRRFIMAAARRLRAALVWCRVPPRRADRIAAEIAFWSLMFLWALRDQWRWCQGQVGFVLHLAPAQFRSYRSQGQGTIYIIAALLTLARETLQRPFETWANVQAHRRQWRPTP
jgi:hypothetical protein